MAIESPRSHRGMRAGETPSCGRRLVPVDEAHPSCCTPGHTCDAHAPEHRHGPGCGHAMVPHGDHVDYLVGGHLHFPCDRHCDDHGRLSAGNQ